MRRVRPEQQRCEAFVWTQGWPHDATDIITARDRSPMQTPSSPRRCWRCAASDSCPRRLLLTCSACTRSWHHRCHVPVVPDSELITRLNNRSIDQWRCRKCTKAITNVPPPMPIYIDLDSPPISVPSSPLPLETASPLITTSDNRTVNLTTLLDDHQVVPGKLCQFTRLAVQTQDV